MALREKMCANCLPSQRTICSQNNLLMKCLTNNYRYHVMDESPILKYWDKHLLIRREV